MSPHSHKSSDRDSRSYIQASRDSISFACTVLQKTRNTLLRYVSYIQPIAPPFFFFLVGPLELVLCGSQVTGLLLENGQEYPLVVRLRTLVVIAEFNLGRTSVRGIRAGVTKWILIHSCWVP